MNAESGWVEIKHDTLLLEAEAVSGSAHHLLKVLVDGLLDKDFIRVDCHRMSLNVVEGKHALPQLHVTPPRLNAVGGSSFDDLVDGQFLGR